MFGVIYAAEGSPIDLVRAVAHEFSPRIEMDDPRTITMDLSGLTRLFGDARTMGEALGRAAINHGLRVRLAIAGTRTAARLLAHANAAPLTVVDPGGEAAALARLPIELLAVLGHDASQPSPRRALTSSNTPSQLRILSPSNDTDFTTLRRWGLRTLGDVAALPADAVAARLGQRGVWWQRLARGEDPRPLLPVVPEERFEQALDLEWPIEGLEPLSFVLGRLMEPLSNRLERRGRGAAVLRLRLHLVTRIVHERTLQLPTPMRDARTLRTLLLLDLESHPPDAAIDRVCISVDPAPARDLQYSLLTRPLPPPEQLSTLMARLTALMGEGRCGSPAVVDSWAPGAYAMKRFEPGPAASSHLASRVADAPAVALRKFRNPVPARVRVEQSRPVSVGGAIAQCAGPWRTAGNWWTEQIWDRDEWDVMLSDGVACRVFRDRLTDAWFLDGIVD